jgi:glycerol-3-phosphate acyltransferase PlsY
MEYALFAIIGYVLGSIPTAVWMGKLKYNIDIRQHGSKNAGATNTFRVLGKKAGIVVLLVDISKGALAVLLPFFIFHYAWNDDTLIHLKIIAGISAVIGHIFPLFARFKGGKGVATSLGIIIGLQPLSALVCLGIFLIIFIAFNYVSLGAIVTAIAFPFVVEFIFENSNSVLRYFTIILSIAVIASHHGNIKRLLAGNENKMNLFKK